MFKDKSKQQILFQKIFWIYSIVSLLGILIVNDLLGIQSA